MKESDQSAQCQAYGRAILVLVILLTGMGLVAVYASSSLKGAQQFSDPFYFFSKQVVYSIVGIAAMLFLQKVPIRWVSKATIPLYVFTFFLLALIFIPGMYIKVGGASRWLALPGIGGQPAELTKIALIMFLARNLSRPSANIDSVWRGVLPNLLAFAAFAALLIVQRDLGTPVLLFAVTITLLFVAGVHRWIIFSTAGVGMAAVALAVIFEPYRMARSLSFLDPWSRVQTGGFQIIQSFLAFKNGGLLGVGLGESKQKLFFLPAAETDFILSVIAEELGLIGVLLICALFFYVSWLGFRIAALQTDHYRKFLAYGLTLVLTLQALMNMGVTMGLLPTKGISLPFVSSGNSALLVFLLLAGILARLSQLEKTAIT